MKHHYLLKIVILGVVCFMEVAAYAQFRDARGPRIMDNLPMRQRNGVGAKINGPRLPPFRGLTGGGNTNWLQQLTSGSSVYDDGTSFLGVTVDAGLAGLGGRFFRRLQATRQSNGTLGEGLAIGLGPLTVGNFTGGVGAFYTDFNTPQGTNDDSGWSSVVTLSSTVNLNLPGLNFGGVLSGYYLPNQDKWGYGTPSPVLSFGSQLGMFAPMASIGLGIKGSLAGWDWVIYDAFNSRFAHPNIASAIFDDSDLNGSSQTWGRVSATLPSEAAIDKVGRYQFGGGAYLERQPDATSRFQAPRFGTNGGNFFSQDRTFFTNSIGAVIGKYINPVVRNIYWFRRDDYWATTNFNYFSNYISGGTYLDHVGNDYVKPYFGYEFGTRDEFATVFHMANIGSYGNLSESTTYLVNLGYIVGGSGVSSTLYDIVLTQRLGYQISHFFGAGRRVTDPTYGERFIADYVNYGLNFVLGPTTTLQAVVGTQKTDGRLTQSGDATATYEGLRLRTTLGSANLSMSAIHENYNFLGGGTNQRDQWIYKVLYGIPVGGSRTMAYTGYQYIDRRSTQQSQTFQEHLFLIYMVHRF